MKIIFKAKNIKEPSVLAVGNFDGVHLGHRAVIEKAKEIAAKKGLPVAVMTFEPHPIHMFRPDLVPARITTLKNKLKLLEECGVDTCYIMKFNKEFASLPAQEFIDKYLKGNHVITGHDFAFGHKRQGNTNMLKDQLGDNFTPVNPKGNGGNSYSSSRVRGLVREGNVAGANEILGHYYEVESRVLHGSAKGKEVIGVATANIKPKPYLLRPKYGVYVVRTQFGCGVANYGVRPTIDGTHEFLEVHIFDFKADIYGKLLNVKFLDFLRDERKFENLDALKKQIKKDIQKATKICSEKDY